MKNPEILISRESRHRIHEAKKIFRKIDYDSKGYLDLSIILPEVNKHLSMTEEDLRLLIKTIALADEKGS